MTEKQKKKQQKEQLRLATGHVDRRPSFEIAGDFVELNFKPIIDADKEENLTKKELRQKRKAEKKANHRRHYLRNAIIAACLLVIIAGATVFVWWNSSSEPVNRINANTYQFDVDEGATVDDVAQSLKKAGFIRSQLAFKIYVRLNGSVIQAGSHMLSPSYKLSEIVEKLATADTDEVDIQIPPGLTLDELRDVFKKYDYTDAEIELAYNAAYDNPILADRPAGATLEGYIYPDTYRVYAGDSLEVVIGKAIDEFANVVTENGLVDAFAAHGLSVYEGVTLASIVTKEVQNADDQKLVASVFYNRLNSGMELGSDVTFKYAYNSGLCSVDSPDCDSVYNTRIYAGLPPGPIANPSLTALQAVAYPTESNYYYFVAGEDGETYFSETADQHNQAVADHCGELCQ